MSQGIVFFRRGVAKIYFRPVFGLGTLQMTGGNIFFRRAVGELTCAAGEVLNCPEVARARFTTTLKRRRRAPEQSKGAVGKVENCLGVPQARRRTALS